MYNLMESDVKDTVKKLKGTVGRLLVPATVLNGSGQNRLSSLDYFASFIYLIRLESTIC